MYSNIIVPYDKSESSKRALEVAIKIATSGKSKIVIFNVIDEISYPLALDNIRFKSKITGEDITKEAFIKEICCSMKNEILQDVQERTINYKDSGVDIAIEVEIGYPPENILKRLKTGRYELVVMGTIGLKGISKITALGSIARKISEKSPCNVLLVH